MSSARDGPINQSQSAKYHGIASIWVTATLSYLHEGECLSCRSQAYPEYASFCMGQYAVQSLEKCTSMRTRSRLDISDS